MSLRKKIYQGYSSELDRTIIFEDIYDGEEIISTEIKGFYFGKPDEEGLNEYYEKTRATF